VNNQVSRRARMNRTFGLAVVLLLLSGLAAYVTVSRVLEAQGWVDHTREVQSALKDVANLSARAGRARTQFVDSGNPAFLQDYETAAAAVSAKLLKVRQLTVDNPVQKDNFNRLEDVTQRRLNLLRDSVQLRQSGSTDAPAQQQFRQEIIDASAGADSILQEMQDEEQQLLDQRQLQSEHMFRVAAYTLCAAFVLALVLFLFHYRLLNTELRAREQAETALRTLSVRLLELQDQERRRFSRELHDSLGQYLVGVKMNLSMLAKSVPNNSILSESLNLLDQAVTETRTISHLLHPPLLDENGFASAARWYVEGFAKRSGIQTSLDLPEPLERLPASLELVLFRVLQEGLTNVHRHSKSLKTEVSLRVFPDRVVLRVRDYGKGMPAEILSRFQFNRAHGGVGLAGMRERIHELGGQLEMESDGHGTEVVAILPRSERKSSAEVFAAD
jgi:signal transduction histidine kinase